MPGTYRSRLVGDAIFDDAASDLANYGIETCNCGTARRTHRCRGLDVLWRSTVSSRFFGFFYFRTERRNRSAWRANVTTILENGNSWSGSVPSPLRCLWHPSPFDVETGLLGASWHRCFHHTRVAARATWDSAFTATSRHTGPRLATFRDCGRCLDFALRCSPERPSSFCSTPVSPRCACGSRNVKDSADLFAVGRVHSRP